MILTRIVLIVVVGRNVYYKLKNEPHIGYLVGNRKAPRLVDGMQKAYNMSVNRIQREHNMKHIYLGPPIEIQIDDTFREFLWQNRSGGYTGQKVLARFPGNGIVVQAVEVIPEDESILFGCERPRLLDGVRQLNQNIFDGVHNMTMLEAQNLIKTISSEFTKLRRLLLKYPCLYDDFQVFLTRTGRIVHLDVDRCFDKGAAFRGQNVERLTCEPLLKYFESKVIDRIASIHNITKIVYEWEQQLPPAPPPSPQH